MIPFAETTGYLLLCLCSMVLAFPLARQSPIILNLNAAPSIRSPISLVSWSTTLTGTYENTRSTVLFQPHNGARVQVRVTGALGNSINYKFCEFHLHWGQTNGEGSEHLVIGQPREGELHMVFIRENLECELAGSYQGADDALVIGVFFQGSSISVAGTIWNSLPIPLPGQSARVSLQLAQLLPSPDRSYGYFHYSGSLTTPNYNPIVQWYVLQTPIQIPNVYLQQLRDQVVPSNNRAIQPLGGRIITRCDAVCMVFVNA